MTRSHQELVERLRKTIRLKEPEPKPAPKPKAPSAAERAVERFDQSHKPTEAVLLDATAHSEALSKRLREERETERRIDYQQALIDRCWAQHRAAQEELEAYGRNLCHRGPGDPDWND